MAFNYQSSAPAAQRSNNDQAEWKADGFINFSLPDADGNYEKLGMFTLKVDNETQKQVFDWLMEDPSRVTKLIQNCRIDFRPAKKKNSVKFNLNSLL